MYSDHDHPGIPVPRSIFTAPTPVDDGAPWQSTLPLWMHAPDTADPDTFRPAVTGRLSSLAVETLALLGEASADPADRHLATLPRTAARPDGRHDVHLADRAPDWSPVMGHGTSDVHDGVRAAVWQWIASATGTGHFRALVTLAAQRAASQGYVRVGDIASRVANDLPDIMQTARERAYLAMCEAFTTGEVVSADAEATARPRVRLTDDMPCLALPYSPVAFRTVRKGRKAFIGPVCETCEHASCQSRWETMPLSRMLMRAVFVACADAYPRDTITRTTHLTTDGTMPERANDTTDDVPLPLPDDMAARFREAARVLTAGGHEIIAGNGSVSPRVWEYLSMAHGRGVGAAAVRRTREEYRSAIRALHASASAR